MFKNACYFRIADGFELPPLPALEKALQKTRFVPTGPTQAESSGWVPPRGAKHSHLAELVGGQLILKLCTEKRAVPSSAIKAGVEEKIERYKKETGQERVGARAKKEFKEEVLLDLLPRAFTKRANTLLWLAPEQKLLVVDSGTLAGADRIVSALLAALLEIPGVGSALDLQLIQTELSPSAAMAHWLSTREAPSNFTIDRDCELKTPDDEKSSVRYARHTLDIDEVAQHIAAGKVPTQLAMTWNDRVSFVLSDTGQVRRMKMLDVVMEGVDKPGKDEDGFDADAAILTGELAGLLPDLLDALGSDSVAVPAGG
ncbi:recombination-associated protein RdgC [Caenimonas sedimenti]|uniref:Recombination-associated protein RdgC n=1 Tax=Caenimonas sedimenti TaxID=2596921 RepID=A0A562ZQ14_9BURK|nr:recombination-associated protein RdgC [Caenimonas sedimenti]TWO70670.1 recombination-associated protein RdgC [Caenimonas sedimenti]